MIEMHIYGIVPDEGPQVYNIAPSLIAEILDGCIPQNSTEFRDVYVFYVFFVEIWAILTLKGYIWRFSYKKSAFCCRFGNYGEDGWNGNPYQGDGRLPWNPLHGCGLSWLG